MDKAELWCNLTDNQRLCLINQVVPHHQRVRQSSFITGYRALERRGVTPAMYRELATWALEQGLAKFTGTPAERYAQYADGQWTFTAPDRPKRGRIDPARLAELAQAGHYATAIAEQLGVTREAVRQAANRQGLTLARKPKRARPVKQPRVYPPKRTNHINIAVSDAELAAIKQSAALRGLRVSAYLREVCAAISAPAAP